MSKQTAGFSGKHKKNDVKTVLHVENLSKCDYDLSNFFDL